MKILQNIRAEAGCFDAGSSIPTVWRQRFDAWSVRCRTFRRRDISTPYFFFRIFIFRINMQYSWYNKYIWNVTYQGPGTQGRLYICIYFFHKTAPKRQNTEMVNKHTVTMKLYCRQILLQLNKITHKYDYNTELLLN